nr:MAG TPA: hypothetical protein [Caudoviricetes sp.]
MGCSCNVSRKVEARPTCVEFATYAHADLCISENHAMLCTCLQISL